MNGYLKRLAAKTVLVIMGAFALVGVAQSAATSSAHDYSFQSIDGDPLPLSQYSGKAVLVVNTASFCGFTPQYEARGLVVLGVPSNDFGGQEPGTAEEIKEFCAVNYAIDFPMTEKVRVKGPDAHPFYQWSAVKLGAMSKPRWNFYKILVAPDGRAVDWFASTTRPDSKKLRQAVERVLPRE